MSRHQFQSSPAADQLFRGILSLQSLEECYRFFGDLLTVQELSSMAQRLRVAELLSQGKTYDQIRGELTISSSTITRINTELRYGAGGYDLVLQRLGEKNKES